MSSTAVALYWDFENIHAGALELRYGPDYYHTTRYRSQEPIVDIAAIMDYAATIGDIMLNRAYNNWQYYSQYRDSLLINSIDLIQLFPKGAHSKNGADIRLALDALDDCRNFNHITDIIIIGGDSDFISLAQKLRQLGRNVIGIGTQNSTNRYWTQSCTEFKFYETIIMEADAVTETVAEAVIETTAPTAPQDLSVAKDLLVRAVTRLTARSAAGDGALKAAVRPMMVRLDSEFDPADYGFKTFNEFLAVCGDLIEIRRGEHDEVLSLRPATAQEESTNIATTVPQDVYRIIKGGGMCLIEPGKQSVLLERLHALLVENTTALRRVEIVENLNADQDLRAQFTENEIPRSIVSRLVQTVSNARCFDIFELGPPVRLHLNPNVREFPDFRRRHDQVLISYALRNGVEFTPPEWSMLLYGQEDESDALETLIAEVRLTSGLGPEAG